MSDEQLPEWITAKVAARILRVSERQIGNYAKRGDLRVVRQGRHVRYSSGDVTQLAQTLQADVRSELPATRQEVNEQMIRYIQERSQRDQEYIDTQRGIAERLDRIEQRLEQPPARQGPSWQVIAVLALVLATALIVLAIVLRLL